jgi:hypothetical protein
MPTINIDRARGFIVFSFDLEVLIACNLLNGVEPYVCCHFYLSGCAAVPVNSDFRVQTL